MTFVIRDARPKDSKQLAELIGDLGHEMEQTAVGELILRLAAQGCSQRVAADGDRVLGLCGLHVMTVIHWPRPVGRITILEVARDMRGHGIGRALVNDAEERLREAGCGLIEVTSNERLTDAHTFYQHLGFDHTSRRFAKSLL